MYPIFIKMDKKCPKIGRKQKKDIFLSKLPKNGRKNEIIEFYCVNGPKDVKKKQKKLTGFVKINKKW